MSIVFISDLHLSQERPQITELFLRFLAEVAPQADALYILGDLFEVWLGDDMVLPDYRAAIDAMRKTAEYTPIYVMYGNRDFLMREAFEDMSGARLIHEPCIIELYSRRTLLLHGDTLCTDDVAYQKFRSMVRDPAWQTELLAKTPEQRLALAREYRAMSKSETAQKQDSIMDVNQHSVEQCMRDNGVLHLIHGHTHRPAFHSFEINGQRAERIVLGDWYDKGNYLRCDAQGCELINFG